MKLSKEQIQALYKFTRQHYVEYYDVQTELVDHLANDIENIWMENPNLTFEQARDKAFKKFGVFGFYDIIQKKEWEMTKKYLKLVLQYTKEWFQIPKIILTAFMFFFFYFIQDFDFGFVLYQIFFYAIIGFQLIYMIINGRKLKQKQKLTGKKWLLENVIYVNGIANILVLGFWLYRFPFDTLEEFLAMGNFTSILAAFLVTIIIIVGYITLLFIPKRTEELLAETYPEYKMIKA